MHIYTNNLTSYFPQYEFKKIKLIHRLSNINELLEFLINTYPTQFNKYIDYKFYNIKNIDTFKWSWDYSNYTNDPNLSLISSSDNITNIGHIYIQYHHSQHNEDYIINSIFNKIGLKNKHFVDIGSKDGCYISNTYFLIKQEWNGLLIDSIAEESNSTDKLTFKNLFVTPDNFTQVLEDNNVPTNFDFLNIDIDGNDIHLVKSLKKHKPRVICIEAYARDDAFKKKKYTEYHKDNTVDTQASILSLIEALPDYSLVYNNAGNCFFVNNSDIIHIPKYSLIDIKSYITRQINIIDNSPTEINTHIRDKNSRRTKLCNYLLNHFENHYPFLLLYDLS